MKVREKIHKVRKRIRTFSKYSLNQQPTIIDIKVILFSKFFDK